MSIIDNPINFQPHKKMSKCKMSYNPLIIFSEMGFKAWSTCLPLPK